MSIDTDQVALLDPENWPMKNLTDKNEKGRFTSPFCRIKKVFISLSRSMLLKEGLRA